MGNRDPKCWRSETIEELLGHSSKVENKEWKHGQKGVEARTEFHFALTRGLALQN
jgi:hypothetical protein